MITRYSSVAVLLLAGVLSVSACASDTPQPVPKSETRTVEENPAPEAEAEPDNGDDGFNRNGVVMMVESQLGSFGGKSHWEGDALITAFDTEVDGSGGLDFVFVCEFMNGLVLEEHTTAVETPSGTTDCTSELKARSAEATPSSQP